MPPKQVPAFGRDVKGYQQGMLQTRLTFSGVAPLSTPSTNAKASTTQHDIASPTEDAELSLSTTTSSAPNLTLEEIIVETREDLVKKRCAPNEDEIKYGFGVSLKLRVLQVGSLSFVVCELKSKPWIELELGHLMGKGSKRRKYSQSEKSAIMHIAETSSSSVASKIVKRTPGFQSLSARQINRWAVPKVQKKMGRPSNDEFRAAVLDNLIFSSVVNAHTVEKLVIEANVVYSWAVVTQAARLVQTSPAFVNDHKVQALKFSKPWVATFLHKSGLNRRRVTNVEKILPPPEQVQAHMEKIQTRIVEMNFSRSQIINADETGIFYGEKPKNQYVPSDADRASTPETDDKSRYTAMLWGAADGEMGDAFCIIKCNVARPDLSSTRVIQNLHNMPGFKACDGWTLHVWERSLALKNKKGLLETSTHRRPYLCKGGTVVTMQKKAWMDSAGIAMWCDTQLGPHVQRKCAGRACLIWDNCGSHNSDAINAVFSSWGIELLPLPPKMTDKLQVMDLVVNAPVKSGIRRDRIQGLFAYFQTWKCQKLQQQALPVDQQQSLPFNPPKPTQAQGLLSLFKVMEENFSTDKFKASLARCFVEACQAPSADGNFLKYASHHRGTVAQSVA